MLDDQGDDMGFFTKAESAPPAANVPVTLDRIQALLAAAEWKTGVDDDGDVFGVWDGHLFYFFLMGERSEILQVRGRYAGTVPLGAEGEVLPYLDGHNRDRIWPKVYSRADSSEIGLYTEVSTDLEHGVADDQLDQLLKCGLFTGLQFFETLSESFPAWAPTTDGADA
ncbi:YbjN domain-containing protein [Sanguibacter sp. A246]